MIAKIGEALMLAAGMAWQVFWSLALGFILSAIVQARVPKAKMQALLGGSGLRAITLASLFGAASSSCSYAAAAMSKTLFKKGAGFAPSLAFLFASTNLVVELGVILWLLLGWQFTVAEWIGGIVMIAVMTIIVRLTLPKQLVDDARAHVAEATGGHDHGSMEGNSIVPIAQNFAMDVSMLWVDVVLGFLIAGALAAFVPDAAWKALFFSGAPPLARTIGDAVVGPLIAVISFVCSIGNVPMAAVLWTSGISFSGVLAFLYADLIVLPLIDVYRKYYGLRVAIAITATLFVSMVAAALIMDGAFSALGLVPRPDPAARSHLTQFSFNYTFYLNVVFALLAAYLWWVDARHPMMHEQHADHSEHLHAGHERMS